METLTADAAKAAETAKAELDSAVAKVQEEAKGKIDALTGEKDELLKKVEELTKSLDFANLDEEGIMDIVRQIKDNPKVMSLIPDIVSEFSSVLGGSSEAAE